MKDVYLPPADPIVEALAVIFRAAHGLLSLAAVSAAVGVALLFADRFA